ncbi:MAG: hypothetical protein EBT15_10825 [Betaproteobacteria bacterium]|nr:hypothetical protein [Betaproteobacteria bacterium]
MNREFRRANAVQSQLEMSYENGKSALLHYLNVVLLLDMLRLHGPFPRPIRLYPDEPRRHVLSKLCEAVQELLIDQLLDL